jgi:hypothetical protein
VGLQFGDVPVGLVKMLLCQDAPVPKPDSWTCATTDTLRA